MEYVKSIKNKLINNSPHQNDNNNDNFSKIDSNKYFNLNVSIFFYLKRNHEDKFLSHHF